MATCGYRRRTDGCPEAFAELDVELDRSNSVFIRIHELPPGSPSFCPHPHLVNIPSALTIYATKPVNMRARIVLESKTDGIHEANLIPSDIALSSSSLSWATGPPSSKGNKAPTGA